MELKIKVAYDQSTNDFASCDQTPMLTGSVVFT